MADGTGSIADAGGAKWGIYVYFAADVPDPDMQAAVWSTMRTLASVGSTDKIKITAMVDLPGRNTEYYIFPQNPGPKVTRWPIHPDRFVPNVDSADTDVILDFFEWSNRNCPADKIALVFWGHGYALDDYDPRIPANAGGTGQSRQRRGKERRAHRFPGDPGHELKLLYDDTHSSVLNNRDFAQAIRDYKEKFNRRKPVQVLGLDCCNMAMAEVLCELQGAAEYAVAAETGLPFQAWLSAPALKMFLGAEYMGAKDLAVGAVEDFIGSFSHSADRYIELSACNLDKFGELEAAMRQLVAALLPAIEKFENRRAIARAWNDDVSFVPDGMIDLSSFCRLLGDYIDENEREVKDASAAVQRAVEDEVVTRAKVVPNFPGRRISLSRGLSIWFPPWIQRPGVRYAQLRQSKEYLFNGYSGTHFAKVTGWDRFLRKLFYLTQR
jgi:hypothetical protein